MKANERVYSNINNSEAKKEDPRIEVFICHCGKNIAGVVDVEKLEIFASTLGITYLVEKKLKKRREQFK